MQAAPQPLAWRCGALRSLAPVAAAPRRDLRCPALTDFWKGITGTSTSDNGHREPEHREPGRKGGRFSPNAGKPEHPHKKHRRDLTPNQHGGWMPHDLGALERFLHTHMETKVRKKHGDSALQMAPDLQGLKLHRSVAELYQLVQDDPIARMLMHRALDQAPRDLVENDLHVNSVETLILAIDAVLDTAPEYEEDALVGFPINALLALIMGTPAGFEAFQHPGINAAFKDILNEWRVFLESPASRRTLNTWLTPQAQKALHMEDYDWDPNDPHGGFKSWNDFFTRPLRTNQPVPRPIASPQDARIVTSACDSHVMKISRRVREQTKFWVKTQPYSLADVLGPKLRDEYVQQFVGGDVYQAFLSATKYHRWHSPVNGKVVAAINVDGTYYSSLDGAPVDPSPPDGSQAYISHVAARAVMIIQADDPIGLMAFVPVGMAEVSSNCIDEKFQNASTENPVPVKKGEQLGMFRYGGSTHLLIFRKGVIADYTVQPGEDVKMGKEIAVAH